MKFLGWPSPQPTPVTPPPTAWPRSSSHAPQQPDQVKVLFEFELMELDIPKVIPYLLDVPQEVISDFDACVHDVLSYQI